MEKNHTRVLPDNPYLLLTPGPLTTTASVKEAMLRDWCTWDSEYNGLVQHIRSRLVRLASRLEPDAYTVVPMQGSGTFSVEATVGSVVSQDGKIVVLVNGAYGQRIVQIARVLHVPVVAVDVGETSPISAAMLEETLDAHPDATHLAVVHCETTTGMLNPIAEVTHAAKRRGLTTIVDAMSSFGGIPLDMAELSIDFLISSSNKCIQGVPGFGFVIARRETLEACRGRARSLSLDLFDQWETMEKQRGKWRFTSPTHVVRAFDQALIELEEEGGPEARHIRYADNQWTLVDGMARLGFRTLLPPEQQSPFITAFHYPHASEVPDFAFPAFYEGLKRSGFVIYPGKISSADTFRIGSIGDVRQDDMQRLIAAVDRVLG
ncbi:2-aminoethylphosphonate--pyruvate transaminase [Paenibacillus sp. MY03]|uniref:2-aminoethylphosphonate--pyruvate transaminase n=1 Tax=Paenibacillus sp. MY03 TaxID=302980 RepID=UPI000B3CAE82|nr:2-aminoethylphosphonate--pyruvate transaminase [Paenibacillus sp. MY03]OUS70633.1 2-aminoethylphosphonate--pyruvate transaminase [Paenibacillus sp. MY03]